MRTVLFFTLLALPLTLRAQSCPVPPHPLFQFQVEKAAQLVAADSTGPRPAHDPLADVRAKSDTFVVQFLVDTTGRTVPASLKILRGGGPTDWAAVRTALPNWRFEPAEAPRGCRVVQLVQTAIER